MGPMMVLEELIERVGGCAVIDGGFATQLEKCGAKIDDPLWSAVCLIREPHLIKEATIPGFLSKGMSMEQAESLLKRSVKLAVDARDSFWKVVQNVPGNDYNRALVAASIGSYGAYLADGSEYSGYYGPDIDLDKLKDFHRRRLQILVNAGPDLLAFEAIPNKIEAQACVELLEEENIQIPSWICFSSVNGEHASSGESFKECLDVLNKSEKVKVLTKKAIAIYPNSGEVWDGRAKRWLIYSNFGCHRQPSECFDDEKFKTLVCRWHELGASLIGGCCRTTPSTIKAVSKVLKDRTQAQ
ncbi:Homocysteine S-methyltransferase 1 [Acorus gramineus]|uniref:Homocysteine S-methyltransferase 1 n=1 Tax=Acorus gramineus TaxID=55184 RepID=A0AAV9BMI0_ACOGR|nr:Homocysteine S-methyltransferase 1 [Acorus gramineus]